MVYSEKFSRISIVLAVVCLLLVKGVHCQTDDAKQIGLIAGCVSGGVILIILIIIVCCVACRKDREKATYGSTLGPRYPQNINQGITDLGSEFGGKGSGTKTPPASDMSTQLSVPPGVWQAKPSMYTGHPAPAYVLAHNRDSAREAPARESPMYGSYSNEPMLTPRKKSSWYNRTWRRAQNALRQIPVVFQVKRSSRENDQFATDEHTHHHHHPSQNRRYYSPNHQPNGTAVREMERHDSKKKQHQQYPEEHDPKRRSSSKRKEESKSARPKDKSDKSEKEKHRLSKIQKENNRDAMRDEQVTRAQTEDLGYSTMPTKTEETDEDDDSPAIPSGPYVAKVFSDYRETPQKPTPRPHETSENVAKAFSSFQNLSTNNNSYQRDPYIARANVTNRHSTEVKISPPPPPPAQKDITMITQSDFSLNRQGRPLGRTHSALVKNGAGQYNVVYGQRNVPSNYYVNKPIILAPGQLQRGGFVGSRVPYGRGVLMQAPSNLSGFGSRQTHSLDRFHDPNERIGGLMQKSVFAAPEQDHVDIVRGNFILRSNTFTPQDTTNKQGRTSSNNMVGIKKGRSSSEKVPQRLQKKQQKNKSHIYAEPTNNENIQTVLRGEQSGDPSAVYAMPKKVNKRNSSLLENVKSKEINNNDNNVKPPPKIPAFHGEKTDNVQESLVLENTSTSVVDHPKAASPVLKEKQSKNVTKDEGHLSDDQVENRRRLKSVSSADVELKEGKAVTADAFKFLEEFGDFDDEDEK